MVDDAHGRKQAAESRDLRVARRNLFGFSPAYPAANLEPYYTGWNHTINRPGGETPVDNSDRDNYFARAMMYGSVLSGALAGHVHGTAAYDVTSTGEPAGWRPHVWTALRYKSGAQMQHLKEFVLSRLTISAPATCFRRSDAAQYSQRIGQRLGWLGLSDAHRTAGFRTRLLREQSASPTDQRICARSTVSLDVVRPTYRRVEQATEPERRCKGHSGGTAVPERW